jgi:glutamate dehydrogenase (NAD(P)+)
VGAGVAFHLRRAGARIAGVSDRDRAVLDPEGLDLEAMLAARDENGLLVPGKLPASCTSAPRDELLSQRADVLVLAAGSLLVGEAPAERIQAPVVVEGANLALTDAARARLHARSVRVVPDVVANSASAALVGHQMASGNTRAPGEVWAEIEASIKRATDVVERVSRAENVDPKRAFRHVKDWPAALRGN